jgi:haloalkane dehalogenase
LIGLGFSDKPSDPRMHQLDNHGRWIGRFIDALGLEELVFVGQDWGGPIGLRALYERRGRCAGMVLLNTVVGPPRPGFKPTLFHRFSQLPIASDLVFRYGGFPQNVMTLVQGDKRSILGDVARAYRYPLRQRRDRTAPLAMARMVPDSTDHESIEPLRKCQSYIEEFDGPLALVWGDRDPILGSVGRYVEKLRPDAAMTHTDAGHFLQEEVHTEIAAAIRDVAARAY